MHAGCMVGWIRGAWLGGSGVHGWVDQGCMVGWIRGAWLGGSGVHGWVDHDQAHYSCTEKQKMKVHL